MIEDADILGILQRAVTAAVAASSTPTLPVKYVDRTLIPPNDQKWLEVVWIPNNRQGDFWGNEKNYRGMLRLVLHWPNENAGPYSPMQVIASVAAYFSKDKLLQNVQIYENPDSMGVVENGAETLYPVSIRYTSLRLGA